MIIRFYNIRGNARSTDLPMVMPIFRIYNVPDDWGIVPEQRTMEVANALWDSFGSIPVDDDGFTTYHWLYWSAGTDREEVWQWFEDTFRGFRVSDKMP